MLTSKELFELEDKNMIVGNVLLKGQGIVSGQLYKATRVISLKNTLEIMFGGGHIIVLRENPEYKHEKLTTASKERIRKIKLI
jgi:hypothetical protein